MTRSASILVVEDDDSVRELLRLVLEDAGHSVRAFGDGRFALAELRRAPVDVVVLDLMMPQLDGWAITQAMQSDPALRRIPIVVFSALGNAAPPAGVAAVVRKPSGVGEVLATVERVLAGERRQAPRYAVALPVTARLGDGEQAMTTRDISQGGLCVTAQSPAAVGERWTASVDLGGDGVAEVELEVRHVDAATPGFVVGARFVAFKKNADGFSAVLVRIATTSSR